LKDFIR